MAWPTHADEPMYVQLIGRRVATLHRYDPFNLNLSDFTPPEEVRDNVSAAAFEPNVNVNDFTEEVIDNVSTARLEFHETPVRMEYSG